MEPIEFWKMNGSGNDFILIDNRDEVIEDDALSRLVERTCRRRESVGADGVILVVPSDRYDFGWRFLNADGGEVEMCGNGGRCVSRFAYLKGIAGPKLTFETLAGPIAAEVNGRLVKVRLPAPKELSMNIGIDAQDGWKTMDMINTGVPHVVISLDDLAHYPVVEQGRAIRYHDHFSPEGTNANFMRVIGQDQMEIRTYERGVEDETLACGTGATAAALVASIRGLVNSPVKVKTYGGEILTIHFKKEGNAFQEVWLEGNTSIVYEAHLHEEAL
jgi:diaminopimelate epimerase